MPIELRDLLAIKMTKKMNVQKNWEAHPPLMKLVVIGILPAFNLDALRDNSKIAGAWQVIIDPVSIVHIE